MVFSDFQKESEKYFVFNKNKKGEGKTFSVSEMGKALYAEKKTWYFSDSVIYFP